MGKTLKWLAIVVVAVIAIGTMIGVDEDTVVFLGETIVLAVIVFVLVAGIVAAGLQDSSSEEEPETKPKKPASNKTKTRFWDDIELTPKDIEDLYINDLFWEAEKKRRQEKNSK